MHRASLQQRLFMLLIPAALIIASCEPIPPRITQAGPEFPDAMPGPLTGLPSFQEVLELAGVMEPLLDPAGRRVAYIRYVRFMDRFPFQLRLVTPDGERRMFGFEDGFRGGAQWTPDGRFLVYIRAAEATGGAPELRFIDPELPYPPVRTIALPEEGVESFALSPDGRYVALRIADAAPQQQASAQKLIGPFDEEDALPPPTHVWLIDLEAADSSPWRLTEGDFSVHDIAWSPTRPELAAVFGPPPGRNNGWVRDIALLDATAGTWTPWVQYAGGDVDPVWSPDGNSLAFVTTLDSVLTNAAPELAVVARPAAGEPPASLPEPVVVTAGFETAPSPIGWLEQGLIFRAEQGTGEGLFLLPEGRPPERRISPPELIVWGGASVAGSAIAFMAAPADGMLEVHRLDLADGQLDRVTNDVAQIADWPLGTRETIRWRAADGLEIEGVLHKPEGFTPDTPRPLVVVVHGGPRAAAKATIAGELRGQSIYPIVHWLFKGALVLAPNYRGSSGYGTPFRQLHQAGIGERDAGDVLAGIRHLIDQGLVDPARVGVVGWSYGGFITAWLSATSTELAAASMGAAITDWSTHYGWEYDNQTTRDFSFGGPPWERAAAYTRASPMTYVDQARTPTLVQHVEDDPIVPLAGGRAFYRALLERGVPTRMIVYPGRSHGIPDSRQRLGSLWHNWQWFARYLWDEEVVIPLEDPER